MVERELFARVQWCGATLRNRGLDKSEAVKHTKTSDARGGCSRDWVLASRSCVHSQRAPVPCPGPESPSPRGNAEILVVGSFAKSAHRRPAPTPGIRLPPRQSQRFSRFLLTSRSSIGVWRAGFCIGCERGVSNLASLHTFTRVITLCCSAAGCSPGSPCGVPHLPARGKLREQRSAS